MKWLYNLINYYGQRDSDTIKELRKANRELKEKLAVEVGNKIALQMQNEAQAKVIAAKQKQMSSYIRLVKELRNITDCYDEVTDNTHKVIPNPPALPEEPKLVVSKENYRV